MYELFLNLIYKPCDSLQSGKDMIFRVWKSLWKRVHFCVCCSMILHWFWQ